MENEFEIIRNEDLQKSNLIQPQEIELKLRPRIPQEISFTIGQSVDYPVDLYFLFDLSFSMNASRNTFAEQSKNIISSIKKLTEDYRIGFGSFIDKDVVPFKSNVDEFNCPKDQTCVSPYSFYHRKSLGVIDPTEFERFESELYYIYSLKCRPSADFLLGYAFLMGWE